VHHHSLGRAFSAAGFTTLNIARAPFGVLLRLQADTLLKRSFVRLSSWTIFNGESYELNGARACAKLDGWLCASYCETIATIIHGCWSSLHHASLDPAASTLQL
jgi:hypothetical protein